MKKFSDCPLYIRLNVLVGSIVMLGIAAIAVFNYHISREHWLREANLRAHYEAALMLNKINLDMQSVEKSTDLLSDIVQHYEGSDNELRALLKNMVSTNANLYGGSILVTDEWRKAYNLQACSTISRKKHPELSPFNCLFGDYFYEGQDDILYYNLSDLEPDFSQLDWYQQAIALSGEGWIDMYHSSIEKKLILSYSIPIFRKTGTRTICMALVIGDLTISRLQKLIESVSINKHSSAFLIDYSGYIYTQSSHAFKPINFGFSSPKNITPQQWKDALNKAREEKTVTTTLPCINNSNRECTFVYRPIPNTELSLGLSYSRSDALTALRQFTLQFSLISVVMLILLLFIISWICLRVTRPLSQLSQAATAIGQGNFNQKLPDAQHLDEVGTLICAFSTMQSKLKQHTRELKSETAKRHRLEGELDAASKIQQAMLPKDGFAQFMHQRIALWAHLVPAKSIGGDFYHYCLRANNRLLFVVGDVSDKGVSAALFMAKSLSIFKQELAQQKPLVKILSLMNEALLEHNDACMFVTLFCGEIDLDSGKVEFISAGHLPPYLIRGNTVTRLPATIAPAIGLNLAIPLPLNTFTLEPNDKLFLFTDGIDETFNEEGNMFGTERIEKLLHEKALLNVKEIGQDCFNKVNRFSAGSTKSDDMTIMVLAFEPDFSFLIPDRIDSAIESYCYNNDLSAINQSLRDIEHFVKTHSITQKSNDIKLIVEELLVNAINYGQMKSHESILLYLGKSQDFILIELVDSGIPFNPLDDAPSPPERNSRQIGGFGIHLVKSLTKTQMYARKGDDNHLCVSVHTSQYSVNQIN